MTERFVRPPPAKAGARIQHVGLCTGVVLAAVYPTAVVLGRNLGVVPISRAEILNLVAFNVAVAILPLLLLRPFVPSLSTRAAFLIFVLVPQGAYRGLCDLAGANPASVAVAAPYLAATILLAARLARSPHGQHAALAALLYAIPITSQLVPSTLRALAHDPKRWASIHQETMPIPLAKPPDGLRPDVYVFVLDALGRSDVLKAKYGLDISDFERFLESKGFAIPRLARSNYAQTYLSLGSFLNLSYLDRLEPYFGAGTYARPFLAYSIRHNNLMALARRAGYHVVAIGSDYAATLRFEEVDACVCETRPRTGIDRAVVASTPWLALQRPSRFFDAHRQRVLDSLSMAAEMAPSPQPLFIFVHVIAPHPPFVLEVDSVPRVPPGPFSFSDGNWYTGTHQAYVSGYRDQALAVTEKMRHVVERLLDRPSGSPVIAILGDHGPGGALDWEDMSNTDLAERMSIFSAYRFPGVSEPVDPETSPINGMRFLADRYFGAQVGQLPNLSYYSDFAYPLSFLASIATNGRRGFTPGSAGD